MKNNFILISIFFSLLFFKISAQHLQYKWASLGIGRNGANCTVIKTDDKGNVYMAGTFESLELQFGSFKLSKTFNPRDMFIAIFDSLGAVKWAAKAGGAMAETLSGMDFDKDGNVYVCGFSYSDVTNFGPLKLKSKRSFIAKYDNKGNVVWVNGYYGSEFKSLAVGADGNPIATGWFMPDSLKVGNFLLRNTNDRQQQMLIAKYNAAGDVLWAKSVGGPKHEDGNAIVCDKKGNFFVTGSYSSDTLIFDGLVIPDGKWPHKSHDICVLKYDTDGNFKWVKTANGSDIFVPYTICLDKNDNIYVSGTFKGYSLQADSFELLNNSTNSIRQNKFLLKYSATGKFCFLKQFDGADVSGVAADENENVFVYGSFSSDSLKMGSSILRNPEIGGIGEPKFFIAKYDKKGEFKWATDFGIHDFNEAFPITNDDKGNIYITGCVRGEKNTLGSIGLNFPKTSAAVFVAKVKVLK